VYGVVQVQITVANGVITGVQVNKYPQADPKSTGISQTALPTLVSEAQSATDLTAASVNSKIAMVSGATTTSEAFISSLQAALQKAGL
jgi:uncharacterized protein with FMN-binding domain